jgi:hypothetical protein
MSDHILSEKYTSEYHVHVLNRGGEAMNIERMNNENSAATASLVEAIKILVEIMKNGGK